MFGWESCLLKMCEDFGVTGKFSPHYISPFEILRWIGTLAYELALPPQLSHVNNVFHVLMLRKYVPDPQHVINFQTIKVQEDVSYEEMPTSILERKEKILRN